MTSYSKRVFDIQSYNISYFGEFYFNCKGEQPWAESDLKEFCKTHNAKSGHRKLIPVPVNPPSGYRLNLLVYVNLFEETSIFLMKSNQVDDTGLMNAPQIQLDHLPKEDRERISYMVRIGTFDGRCFSVENSNTYSWTVCLFQN